MLKNVELNSKAFLIAAIFTIATCIGLAFEFYYSFLIPPVIAVVLIALHRYDYLLGIIIISTPLSFNFENLAVGGIGFYFPTEPLLFGMLLLFALQSVRKSLIDKKWVDHPVSVIVIFSLFWMAVCTYTSSMPMVSFKYLLARLWFVVALFYMAGMLFKNKQNIMRYVWFYLVPLAIVIIYTVAHHAINDFSHDAAHWVMSPFYKDHTSYGAVLALYLPVTVLLLIYGKFKSDWVKPILIAILTILVIGLILSYTRAAWVSILGAFGVWCILKFKIPSKLVYTGAGLMVVLFFVYQNRLFDDLEKNRQDSSDNLSEHVESISNISSDASNLERINRWNSALRMFADRPVFGFGPGTYMFQYAPFQKNDEKTIISTNLGEVGNAHSEYLGPLSEGGLFGSLSFIALLIASLYYGINLYKRIPEDDVMKQLVLGLVLGLITYYIHGILNNYLDTDKASVPFWTFIASIVALDIYHYPKNKKVKA
tara:strand:- start:188036 stop:189481 length:1446 start_codon:yes stop_codon:yes gene_type:complete